MRPASVVVVEVLFFLAVVAFLDASESVWGLAFGTGLLMVSVIVALRYRVSFRCIFRRPPDDDPHKLYNSRHA